MTGIALWTHIHFIRIPPSLPSSLLPSLTHSPTLHPSLTHPPTLPLSFPTIIGICSKKHTQISPTCERCLMTSLPDLLLPPSHSSLSPSLSPSLPPSHHLSLPLTHPTESASKKHTQISPICERCNDQPPGVAQVLIAIVKHGVCLPYGAVVLLPIQAKLTQPFKGLAVATPALQHLVYYLSCMNLENIFQLYK